MAPDEYYRPYYDSKEMAEAVELIGIRHSPDDNEKKEADSIIEDFATSQLPEAFYLAEKRKRDRHYQIYPRKFLPETWEKLEALRLAGKPSANADYLLSEPAGLSLMSILADCCAGDTKARITDRGVAYETVAGLWTAPAQPKGQDYESLVSLSLEVLDMQNIPLRNLIDFRKREQAEAAGGSLTRARHSYLQRIESGFEALKKAKRPGDVKQLKKDFKSDLQKDYSALYAEISRSKTELYSAKETLTALGVVIAGAAAAAIVPFHIPAIFSLAGGIPIIGGALAVSNKYASSRAAIMDKHPMAYLYQLDRSR
jgi:hypothetical protein